MTRCPALARAGTTSPTPSPSVWNFFGGVVASRADSPDAPSELYDAAIGRRYTPVYILYIFCGRFFKIAIPSAECTFCFWSYFALSVPVGPTEDGISQ